MCVFVWVAGLLGSFFGGEWLAGLVGLLVGRGLICVFVWVAGQL
jgi:hypothetical protein